MRTKVGRWGNSLAVRLPNAFVQDMSLAEGTSLSISQEGDRLVLHPEYGRPVLDTLVAGITEDNLHSETDWDQTAGAELW